VATGLLGGPIYDVVDRLTVQPGYVIVAGLSGSPDTDFDMYLFDATATTVVSNHGLVAKSTGPGSSERLNYPSFSGGTYYLDLNAPIQGATLTIQIVKDSTVPTASLLLAGGRPSTNSTTVDVTLTASVGIAGLAAMAFSPDGLAFGPWQAYTVATTWTFPAGDGTRTLWAKVRSGTGVESAPVSASIDLDTAPPSVEVIIPTPNTSVAGLRPTFTVGFNEPVQLELTDHGLVVQAGNGSGCRARRHDSRTSTGTFALGICAGRPVRRHGRPGVGSRGEHDRPARLVAGGPEVPDVGHASSVRLHRALGRVREPDGRGGGAGGADGRAGGAGGCFGRLWSRRTARRCRRARDRHRHAAVDHDVSDELSGFVDRRRDDVE
jgi:hypothetical protein